MLSCFIRTHQALCLKSSYKSFAITIPLTQGDFCQNLSIMNQNSLEQTVLNEINKCRDEFISFPQKLIRCPSSNQPGDTRSTADAIVDFLDKDGIPSELIAPQELMPNVFHHSMEKPEKAPASCIMAVLTHFLRVIWMVGNMDCTLVISTEKVSSDLGVWI